MLSNSNNPWENQDGQSNSNQINSNKNRNLNDLDFRRLLATWPYALLFGIIGFFGGKIYTRYIVTTYSVATKINIQQKEEITLQQAVVGTSRDPFNDRIAYLRSPALAINVVKKLDLKYNTILQGKFKDKNLYNFISWKFINPVKEKVLDDLNFSFKIIPNDNYKFEVNYKNKALKNFEFGKVFLLDTFLLKVDSLKAFTYNSPIICSYKNEWDIALIMSNAINVKADKESNIIDITYTDVSTDRAKDILGSIILSYNNSLDNDKSKGYSQAIEFISKRLQPLSNELDSIESNLAGYQAARGFVNEQSNGALFLEKVQDVDKKLIDIEIQKANIDTIEKYVYNNNKEFSYNIIGLSDLNLQNNVTLLQQLNLEKDKLSNILTPNHANIKIIENNIAEAKKNIQQQIIAAKKNIDISQKLCLSRIANANQLIRNTPADEKGLIEIKRMRNIKEALFLTLLQKREEAGIAKASTTIDTKVLNPPTVIPTQQKPSKPIIIAICSLLGLIVPLVFFVAKELMNNKIIALKQLENYLQIPVIAELEFVDKGNKLLNKLLTNKDRSMFSEQLRALRTQLNFYKKENKNITVLITSNISGEGKSFIALNLAKSFALQNKKVALLEFDLRRPKISKEFNIEKTQGLSNYLMGNVALENILLNPVSHLKDFYFFPSGPIPPNPQELLSDDKIDQLKQHLHQNYDVVIIDTPPFGIVADAQILSKLADITLVITRFNYTVKEQIIEIDKWNKNKIFNAMAVVYNGIKHNGYYGNKYGYNYYKRKYGYDYYSNKTD